MERQERGAADILAVFAHPDDESWGCGGMIARYSSIGYSCMLITATAGEMGFPPDQRDSTTVEERKQVRMAELAHAAKIIGLSGYEVLGLPDGGLKRLDTDQLAEQIATRIEQLRPRVVVTFDRTGVTGHRDHIAVHEATTRAFSTAAPVGSRLLYQVIPARSVERVRAALAKALPGIETGGLRLRPWEGLPPEEDGSAGAFFVPDSTISVELDVTDFAEKKRTAILAHESQVGEVSMLRSLPHEVLRAFLGWEYFHLASGPEYRSLPARDIFEN